MIGSRFAHYQITSHLGSGGMGDVYQATDLKLGRSVAIKLLPEAFARDTERVARFDREARVLASLNHPNIAAVYGVEENAIVMEPVEGQELPRLPGSPGAGGRRDHADILRSLPASCWSGGTGRRTGLKIPRPSLVMWVRPPPPAPI